MKTKTINIKGYLFDILKTATGIYYLIPIKRNSLSEQQQKMIEDLVLNNRDLYVGTDLKRLKKKISLFIKRNE